MTDHKLLVEILRYENRVEMMNQQTISKRVERARTLLASAVERLMDIDEMNGREDIYSMLDEVNKILYAVAQATDPSPFDP